MFLKSKSKQGKGICNAIIIFVKLPFSIPKVAIQSSKKIGFEICALNDDLPNLVLFLQQTKSFYKQNITINFMKMILVQTKDGGNNCPICQNFKN